MPRKSVKRKVLIEIHDKIDIANEHSKKLKHVDGDFLDFERFQKNAELIEKGFYLHCQNDFFLFFEFCKVINFEKPLGM